MGKYAAREKFAISEEFEAGEGVCRW